MPYEHLDEVVVGAVGLELRQPVLHLGEALPGGHVVDQDGPLGPPVVARGQGPEPLLARCVPYGQLYSVSLLVHHFHFKVDPYSSCHLGVEGVVCKSEEKG